jgi:ketosteroid isomerase-like protein
MNESPELKEHFEQWMAAVGRADVEGIVDAYLEDEGIVVVGIEGDGWIEGHDALREAFAREAADYEITAEVVRAFDERDVGCAVGRLTLHFADRSELTVRATAAASRTAGGWKMVTTHLSLPRAG